MQYVANCGLLARDHRVELVAQGHVTFAHAHGDIELELQRREALCARDGRDLQRHRRVFREVAAQRSPYRGDIDVPLLDRLDLPASNVHAFPASDSGLELDEAADAYARELARFPSKETEFPRFDITFLGVGPDGHISSLFPDRAGIRESERTVIAVRDSPKPPPERLSLTRPVLNASARIWLVLAGADKASALGLALAGASYTEVPAAGAKGRKRTVFFVDRDASAEVPENLIAPEY